MSNDSVQNYNLARSAAISMGTIAGAGIAGFFTGGLGAAGGGAIGGIVVAYAFSYIFPPPRPDLPDPFSQANINSVRKGGPIYLVYGTAPIPGSYFWLGDLTHEEYTINSGGGGMSGGGKDVPAGYRYYVDSALALSQGEVYTSRLWANDKQVHWRSLDTITIYNGGPDQVVDPLLDSETTDATPLKYLSHMVLDGFYLGKDKADVPQVVAEQHRFPFNSNAGDTARIYAYDSHLKSATGDYGISVKDSLGNIWMMCEYDDGGSPAVATWGTLKKYNADLSSILATFDLAQLDTDYTLDDIHDAIILEFNKKRQLLILFGEDSTNKLRVLRFSNLDKLESWDTSLAEQETNISESVPYDVVDIFTNNARTGPNGAAGICWNESNVYIWWSDTVDTGFTVRKYNWELSAYTEYDLSSDLGYGYSGLTVSEKYAFAVSPYATGDSDKIITYDLSDFSKIDDFDISSSTYDHMCRRYPEYLRNGNEFVCGGFNPTGDTGYLFVFGIDDDGDNIEHRKTLTLTEADYWAGDEPEFSFAQGNNGPLGPAVKWCPDGNLLFAFHDQGTYHRDYKGVLQVEMYCNPAQVIYDIAVEQAGFPSAKVDTTLLSELSEWCWDNQIGIAGVLDREMRARSVIQEIMTNMQGITYRTKEGKLGVKVFADSDTSQATITQDDIIYERNGQVINPGIVDGVIKSINEMPNQVEISFVERKRKYQTRAFPINNFMAQNKDGFIRPHDIHFSWIQSETMVKKLGLRAVKHMQYAMEAFSWDVGTEFLNRERGDVITLSLTDKTFEKDLRIIEINEVPMDTDFRLRMTGRIEEAGINTLEDWDVEGESLPVEVTNVPTQMIPVIWEEDALFNNDKLTLCIAGIRQTSNVMGYQIYVSDDAGSSYRLVDDCNMFASLGKLQSAIDADDKIFTINTGSRPETFATMTAEQQLNDESYCLLGDFQSGKLDLAELEFIAYREVETNGDDLDLKNIHRGRNYTIPKAHESGDDLVLVGYNKFFRFKDYNSQKIGQTIYVKLVAYTQSDIQDIGDVESFTYTIQGYTRKASHAAGVELVEGGVGQGSRIRTSETDVIIQWADTNRIGGIDRVAFDAWTQDGFIEGDVDDYDIIVYDSDGTTIITTKENIGNVNTYTYEESVRTADFGGVTNDFWLGVVPKNPQGDIRDIAVVKQHCIVV